MLITYIIGKIMDVKINDPAREARRKIFLSREKLDHKIWYQKYYEPLGLSFHCSFAIAKCLANIFRCDLTQFLPSDAFDKEFKFTGIHWMGIDEDDEMMTFTEGELEDLLGKTAYKALAKLKVFPNTIAELVRFCEPYLAEKEAIIK